MYVPAKRKPTSKKEEQAMDHFERGRSAGNLLPNTERRRMRAREDCLEKKNYDHDIL